MSIRWRLTLSFGVILFLFGLNLLIHLWSNKARAASIEDVRRAITRQSLLASISHRLSDIQKQVTLLAQMPTDPLSPAVIGQFTSQLEAVRKDINSVVHMSDADARQRLNEFRSQFETLGSSWRVFYSSVGSDPARAITELAVRGEPIGQELIHRRLPELQRQEESAVNTATGKVYEIAELTGRITIAIFVCSTGIAFLVAWFLSRYLTRRLEILRSGAAAVGAGHFDHSIQIRGGDELGELASAFNDMRESLGRAHEDLTGTNIELQRRHSELENERRVSESLLLNILPEQIAGELRTYGAVQPKCFNDVTIMFTDFVRFSTSTEDFEAERLVEVLHEYFTAFDEIMCRYGLEKLKTIGDSYMCAGGLPGGMSSHPVDMILAAMEILGYVKERAARAGKATSDICWDIRIGIHTGPVIAGVVGIRKFAFDVWGPTVNFSSRMESSGVPNRINISEATFRRVQDFFECEYRGKILTKDHRNADMYLVNGIVSALSGTDDQIPPKEFARAYVTAFDHELPGFPVIKTPVAASF